MEAGFTGFHRESEIRVLKTLEKFSRFQISLTFFIGRVSAREAEAISRTPYQTLPSQDFLRLLGTSRANHELQTKGGNSGMRQATGIISVVQEGRFRLDYDDGRSQLFVLDRHAAIEPQDLQLLALEARRITVEFDETPSSNAAVAHAVGSAAGPA